MAVCKYFSVNSTCFATKDNEFVNCNPVLSDQFIILSIL